MTDAVPEQAAPGSPDAAVTEIEAAIDAVIHAATRARAHAELMTRAGVDLDRASAAVLRFLSGCASELRLRDVAQEIGVEPSSVTRKVQQLEQQGLVVRFADPADGRAFRLSLTAAGHRAIDALLAARRDRLAELLADWSEPDRATFARLLRQFAGALTGQGAGS